MQTFKGFLLHKPSVDLSQLEGIRFYEGFQDVTPSYGSPVGIYQTQGRQIVGVPPELTRVLPSKVTNRGDGVKKAVTCHFETEQAFYLPRVQMVCHMDMPF